MGPRALLLLRSFPYNISMKTCKLWLLICVISVCSPAAFAQTAKGLKYVPQSVKGAKSVPYVVSPKVSPAVRMNLAVPVVRPNVAAPAVRPNVAAQIAPAVERAVVAKLTVQDRLARLGRNLNALEEYARTHHNRLPQMYQGMEGFDLREQVIRDITSLKREGVRNHRLFKQYNQLIEANKFQPTLDERTKRLDNNLKLLEEYARTHNNRLPDFYSELMRQVRKDIASLTLRRLFKHPLMKRYNQLVEAERQQSWQDQENYRQRKLQAELQQQQQKQALKEQQQASVEQQKRQEQFIQEFRAQEQREILRQEKEFLQQEKAWADLIAEEQQRTEAEEVTDANAAMVATKAEGKLSLEGNVTTDDYVEQLLNFYNKLDPLGTGTIQ